MATLEVADLRKAYPTPAEPLVVLDGVSLAMERGESLAIVGPSGCGKSTLLMSLGTLDTPTAGAVTLDGIDPFTLRERDLARFRAERLGLVFQEHYLLPQLGALENVLAPLLATGRPGAEGVRRAERLLDRVGLSGRLRHRPAELSGGERQRVAIARALVRDPLLVLADEPTGSLDAASATAVADLLAELHAERQGLLIVVTHSAELAGRLGRRATLRAGRLGPL